MDRRLSPNSRPDPGGGSGSGSGSGVGSVGLGSGSGATSPGSSRRTTAPTVSSLTLSPLLGLSGGLMGGPRVTARRSWSPQHQSSLEVPTPRQIQSARNSLAATGTTVRQQNSIEVCCLISYLFFFTI